MRGTLVCGVTDSEDAAGTVELAVELTQRLGMRLVLAHVAEGSRRSATVLRSRRA